MRRLQRGLVRHLPCPCPATQWQPLLLVPENLTCHLQRARMVLHLLSRTRHLQQRARLVKVKKKETRQGGRCRTAWPSKQLRCSCSRTSSGRRTWPRCAY